jgi:tetratricopeptide (TPR) repeat protein
MVSTAVADVNMRAATLSAPPPTATPDPATNLVTGDNAWTRGDIPSALEQYTGILGAVPNDAGIHSRVAIGHYLRGDDAGALDYAEQTVTAEPLNPRAWETLAFIQAATGQPDRAISSALQALDYDPGSPSATAYLGYAYLRLERYDLARSRAEDAIRTNPNTFEGYWVRGMVRENADFNFSGALEDFRTAYDLAREQNPALAETIGLAIALIQLNQSARARTGDFSATLATLDDILQVNPQHAGALLWLGRTYYAYVGDPNQALDPLERCVEVDTDNYFCYYFLGRTQNDLGDQIAAMESFERAIELDTPYAQHYFWAGRMHALALGSCSNGATYIETGYRMAIPGDLPAADEGNWIEDFQYLIDTCQLNIGSSQPQTRSQAAPTATPLPSGADA